MELIIVGFVCLVIGILIGLAIPVSIQKPKIDGFLYMSSQDERKTYGIDIQTDPPVLAKQKLLTLSIDRSSDL